MTKFVMPLLGDANNATVPYLRFWNVIIFFTIPEMFTATLASMALVVRLGRCPVAIHVSD